MSKAAADSSVLINFAKANRLDLFMQVFEKPLNIPEEVYQETVIRGVEKKEKDSLIIDRFVKEKKIKVTKVGFPLEFPFLDAGEKAVLSLARQEKIQVVCIDEAQARNAAKLLGLKPIGSLGILNLAIKQGLLTKAEAMDLLDEMINQGYRISAKILEKFRKTIGE